MPFAVRLSSLFVVLSLLVVPLTARSGVVLSANGIEVTEDEVIAYLSNNFVPETVAKALERPDTLPMVTQNLYLIERFAQISLEAGLIDQYNYDWVGQDAAARKAMDNYIDAEIERRLDGADWDAAAKERYLAKPELYSKGVEVNAAHILISLENRSWDELAARVAEVQQRLDAGEDFFALVKEYSEDPSAERNGGTLGFFGRGAMYPSFEKAVYAMEEEGELAGPVVTVFGVHFIRYIGRREGERPAFEQVAHLIKKDMKDERRNAMKTAIIEELRTELRDAELNVDEARIRERLGLSSEG